MPESKHPQVTFRYKISPNYAVYSIAGAHGGLNSQGDVVVNLFSERAPIPRRQTFRVNSSGKLDQPPLDVESETAIIRDVMFALAMEPETARSVGQWLIDRANEHNERVIKLNIPKESK